MVFIELPLFRSLLRIDDEELRLMQNLILEQPDAGAVLIKGHGLRKLRVPLPGRGKSGGARLIYYWRVSESLCYLVLVYPKALIDDLSDEQLKKLSRELRKAL